MMLQLSDTVVPIYVVNTNHLHCYCITGVNSDTGCSVVYIVTALQVLIVTQDVVWYTLLLCYCITVTAC